jgi:hypothetical protein
LLIRLGDLGSNLLIARNKSSKTRAPPFTVYITVLLFAVLDKSGEFRGEIFHGGVET